MNINGRQAAAVAEYHPKKPLFFLRIAQRITSIGGWGILPQLGGWKPPPRESLK
jgi:hypothetical protein